MKTVFALASLVGLALAGGHLHLKMEKSRAIVDNGMAYLTIPCEGGNGDYSFNYYNLPNNWGQSGNDLISPFEIQGFKSIVVWVQVADKIGNSMDDKFGISVSNGQVVIDQIPSFANIAKPERTLGSKASLGTDTNSNANTNAKIKKNPNVNQESHTNLKSADEDIYAFEKNFGKNLDAENNSSADTQSSKDKTSLSNNILNQLQNQQKQAASLLDTVNGQLKPLLDQLKQLIEQKERIQVGKKPDAEAIKALETKITDRNLEIQQVLQKIYDSQPVLGHKYAQIQRIEDNTKEALQNAKNLEGPRPLVPDIIEKLEISSLKAYLAEAYKQSDSSENVKPTTLFPLSAGSIKLISGIDNMSLFGKNKTSQLAASQAKLNKFACNSDSKKNTNTFYGQGKVVRVLPGAIYIGTVAGGVYNMRVASCSQLEATAANHLLQAGDRIYFRGGQTDLAGVMNLHSLTCII